MKVKACFMYFMQFILIVCLFTAEVYIMQHLNQIQQRTFRINPVSFLIPLLINSLIGIIMGFGTFMRDMKRNGRIRINLSKIVFLALPSAYLSFTLLAIYSGSRIMIETVYYLAYKLFVNNSGYSMTIFQILLGYSLITSFYREERQNDSEEYYDTYN